MQEILSTTIQVIRKQLAGNYWTGILLNGAATMFLDEDQLNLLKVTLVLTLPIAAIYLKIKVSELSAFSQTAVKAVVAGSLLPQGCCS